MALPKPQSPSLTWLILNHVSPSEQKIDLIDRRLETITQLLHELQTLSLSPAACSNASAPTAHLRVSPANPTTMASSSTPIDGTSEPITLENPFVDTMSSGVSQFAFSNSFPQQAVHNERLQGLDLDVNETVDSMHSILGAFKQQTSKSEMSYPLAEPSLRPSFRGCQMPPIEKAVALLHGAKSKQFLQGVIDHSQLLPPLADLEYIILANSLESAGWLHELFPVGNLSSICLRVYFSEEISEADFIIANSGLLQLFVGQSEGIPDKTESLNNAHICRTNIETALINLPLHLPATPPMISALLLGVSHSPWHFDIIHFI